MTKKTDTPAIRFKGFSDTWEQRKLGELALFNPKDELPQTFEYVDLESVVGTEMLSHRTEVKSSAPSRAQRLANTGDLFYQTVRPYQKNNYLFEKPDNNYVFSTGYAQMRPYVDGYFLLSLVQSERFVKVVLDNCTGTSYPAINANDLAEIEVAAPSDESEAQKIGAIFRSIDNLITLHQRKYEKLHNIKKSMLEKMFPKNGSNVPEIRFKGFTEAWEQRKVSEITKFHKQGFYTTEEYDNSKKYYLLRGTDLTENKLVLKDTPKIDATEKDYDAFKTEIGDFLIVRSGTVGTYGIVDVDIPAIFGSYLIDFRFDMEQVTNEFFGYFYQSSLFKSQLNKIIQASANTNINAENIKSTVISLPSLNEQRRISEYLGNLDNLITLHQRELEKLQNIKKSMLEKMFV